MGSVLHICGYAASCKGNFINSLLYLEERLKKQDKNTVYIFPKNVLTSSAKTWIDELQQDGKIIYTWDSSDFRSVFFLKKIIKKHNVETVFQHFTDLKTDIIVRLSTNKKVLNFFHSIYDPSGDSRSHKLKSIIYPKSKKYILVGVSNFSAERLKKHFHKHTVVSIPNGVFFERLKKTNDFPELNHKILCMTMGYDIHIKGVDLTIKAINQLRKKYDIGLGIIASPKAMKEKLEKHLGEDAKSMEEWITFLPPTEDIGTYFKNADIFLAASRTESFCYAMIEAAFCNTTIVASDIPAQVEHNLDSVSFFKSSDVENYVSVLEKAILNMTDENHVCKKEKDSKYVQNRYSLENWASIIEKLI